MKTILELKALLKEDDPAFPKISAIARKRLAAEFPDKIQKWLLAEIANVILYALLCIGFLVWGINLANGEKQTLGRSVWSVVCLFLAFGAAANIGAVLSERRKRNERNIEPTGKQETKVQDVLKKAAAGLQLLDADECGLLKKWLDDGMSR